MKKQKYVAQEREIRFGYIQEASSAGRDFRAFLVPSHAFNVVRYHASQAKLRKGHGEAGHDIYLLTKIYKIKYKDNIYL